VRQDLADETLDGLGVGGFAPGAAVVADPEAGVVGDRQLPGAGRSPEWPNPTVDRMYYYAVAGASHVHFTLRT
jgi:hypothetical protein